MAFLFAAFVLSVPGCAHRSAAPIGLHTEGPIPDDELRVLEVTPVGQTERWWEISVRFSAPVVSFEGARNQVGEPILRFDPPIEGEHRWAAPDLLRFHADTGMPRGVSYDVVLPAGLEDASGTRTLRTPVRWSFQTPRPRLYRMENPPADGLDPAAPGPLVVFLHNGEVEPAAIAPFIRLDVAVASYPEVFVTPRAEEEESEPEPVTYGPPSPVPFQVRTLPEVWPGTHYTHGVAVVPEGPLPPGAQLTLRVDPGWVGAEGPLPADEAFVRRVKVREPFRVVSVTCWETPCRPDSDVEVTFNHAIHRSARDAGDMAVLDPGGIGHRSGWGRELTLGPPAVPETVHTVTVRADLPDVHRQPLPETVVELWVDDFRPGLHVERGLRVIDRRSPHTLVAWQHGLEDVRVRMAPVPADEFRTVELWRGLDAARDRRPSGVDLDPLPAAVAAAREVEARAHGSWIEIPLGLDVPLGEAGAVYYEITAGEHRETGLVQFTAIGLTARGDDRQQTVLVSDLASAEPLPGARLEIREWSGEALWSGSADADGRVDAPGWRALGLQECTSLWAVVEVGDDRAFLRLPRSCVQRSDELVGHLVADRALYQPGEAIRFKGYARIDRTDGLAIGAGILSHMDVELRDEDGVVVQTAECPINARGNFHGRFELPVDSALGRFGLMARAPADEPASGDETSTIHLTGAAAEESRMPGELTTRLKVAEFRMPEFEVELEPVENEIVRGDTLQALVTASHLHGLPVSEGKVGVGFSGRWATHRPPGHPGVSFEPPDEYRSCEENDGLYGQRLGPAGQYDYAYVTRPGVGRPVQLHLGASVSDIGNQSGSASTRVLVHPGEFYLGIQLVGPQGFDPHVGGELTARVFAVHPDGRPFEEVERIRDLTIELTPPQQPYRGVYEPPVFATCRPDVLGPAPVVASCSVEAGDSGYWTAIVRAGDPRGNTLAAKTRTYVSTEARELRETAEDGIEGLIADKELYRPGETARIAVVAPQGRYRGLLTRERGGLREARLVALDDGGFEAGPVELDLDERDLPATWITLQAFGERRGFDLENGIDVGAPRTYHDTVELDLDEEAQRLTVEVAPDRETARPGDEIEVRVRVRDADGRPAQAEVTLWAVDEGVLLLEKYAIPDLLAGLYGGDSSHRYLRGWDSWSSDLRHQLARRLGLPASPLNPWEIEVFRGSGLGGGGTGEGLGGLGTRGRGRGEGFRVRSRFQTTPVYEPEVETDGDGEAVVRFTLPDNLTRFRVFAMASSGIGRFGSGESTVTVRLPLMVRPALPRFLSVGDRFAGGAIVRNGSDGELAVEVELEARGIGADGEPRRTVVVAPGRAARVDYEMCAESAGEATVEFRAAATSGDVGDGVRVTLPVQSRTLVETTAAYGVVEDRTELQVGLDLDVLPGHGGLDLTLWPSGLAGLRDASLYLVYYPHGCVEQLSSGLVPLITLGHNAGELMQLDPDEVAALAGEGIRQIQEHAHETGGFAYWPGGERTVRPFASVYATLVLGDAARAGYTVDAGVLAGAREYTLQVALGLPPGEIEPDVVTRALALYTLAAEGELPVEAAEIARTLARRPRTLPLFARLWLIRVLVRCADGGTPVAAKKDLERADELLRTVLDQANQTGETAHLLEPDDGLGRWMHSTHRTDAIGLEVLLEVDPEHSLVEGLAAGLFDARRHGRWRSTQENAWVMRALSRYLDTLEPERPSFDARAVLADDLLIEHHFEGRGSPSARAVVPVDQLVGEGLRPLVLTKEGRGRLHYRLGLSYAPADQDLPAIDRGFEVERCYLSRDPAPVEVVDDGVDWGGDRCDTEDDGRIPLGSYVEVELTVTTSDLHHWVVIEDPLPAGFEPVYPTQAEMSSRAYRSPRGNVRIGSYLGDTLPVDHSEYHHDRVLFFCDELFPGTYTLRYRVRTLTQGEFHAGPAVAEEMYDPEVFGRSEPRVVGIVPRESDH